MQMTSMSLGMSDVLSMAQQTLAAGGSQATNGWEIALAVCAGLGIAAACGFRVFVPLLVLAVASKAGWVTLGPSFAFVGSWAAIIALSVATVAEVGAYHIPWLDHALDTLATPAAVVAGAVAMLAQTGAVATPLDPWMQWLLGAVAGGAAAGAVQGGTMLLRAVSTITTGGLGNPVIASAEAGLALLTTILAILVPALAIGLLLLGALLVVGVIRRRRSQRREVVPAMLPVAE